MRARGKIQEERHMSMILVTHNLGIVAGRTDEVAVMYGGRIVERSPTEALFRNPRHRYTEALLAAMPRADQPAHARLRTIAGQPPDLLSPSPGVRSRRAAQPLTHNATSAGEDRAGRYAVRAQPRRPQPLRRGSGPTPKTWS
jgi:oligopeptide/dipeptide ABC transporter ATP-binding protein